MFNSAKDKPALSRRQSHPSNSIVFGSEKKLPNRVQSNTSRYEFYDKVFEGDLSKERFPQHVFRRNQKNESTLSLKQDFKSQKDEELSRQENIKWTVGRNKFTFHNQNSFVKHENQPYPSMRIGKSTTNADQKNLTKHLELIDFKANTILQKEFLTQNMARNFQSARERIKFFSSNKQDNQVLKQGSNIYSLTQKKVEGDQSQQRKGGMHALVQRKPEQNLNHRFERNFNLSMGQTRRNKPQEYRTTFQEEFVSRKIQRENFAQLFKKENQTKINLPISMLKNNDLNSSRNSVSTSRLDYIGTDHHDDLHSAFITTKNMCSKDTIGEQLNHLQKEEQKRFSLSPKKTLYQERYSQGTISSRDLSEANSLNKMYKDRLLNSNFELGGKLLISPDLDGPMRLLDSEKRATYFKQKVLSTEANALRSKFKDKIERQNWTIKSFENKYSQVTLPDRISQNERWQGYGPESQKSLPGRICQSFAAQTSSIPKLQSNFMLGYTNARYDSISRNSQSKQGESRTENFIRSQVKNKYRSNVFLGSNREQKSTNYKDQFTWNTPKYDY